MTELTTAERKAQGKAAREKAPLESHAEIGPDAGRDPVDLLDRPGGDRGSRSWCRSGTAACWSRRSRSTAARRC